MLSLVFDPAQFSQLVENAVRCALDKADAERQDAKTELPEKLALPTAGFLNRIAGKILRNHMRIEQEDSERQEV